MIVMKIKCEMCPTETEQPNGGWFTVTSAGGLQVLTKDSDMPVLPCRGSVTHFCSPACFRAFFNNIINSIILQREVPQDAPVQVG